LADDTDFREDELQLENESDVSAPSEGSFSSAVVSGNDWTTETLINQIDKGNILLNPSFQRRDAWDPKRKSKFIESLILGLPVPQVVLAESKEKRGAYIVLDGKQRLLSIRQFSAEDDDPTYVPLKLRALEIRDDLNGHNLSSLRENVDLFDDLSSFENQPIRTVVIKNWPDEAFLYHVFLRLNTGSVPLSPQELRQALHPGPFVSFLDEASTESHALRAILKLKKPDFRMRDAELLLRYLSFKNYLSLYTGTLKKFLDEACQTLNDQWSDQEDVIREQLDQLEQSHNAVKQIFGGNSYRKWSGEAYESRFNRAVFDVLILSFSIPNVRAAAVGRENEIENAFKQLCSGSSEFTSAIESTTKSIGATHSRISLWNSILNGILDVGLHVPEIIDNRIV
jgi:hypothetical protein